MAQQFCTQLALAAVFGRDFMNKYNFKNTVVKVPQGFTSHLVVLSGQFQLWQKRLTERFGSARFWPFDQFHSQLDALGRPAGFLDQSVNYLISSTSAQMKTGTFVEPG
jgi:gluconate kinase